MEPLDINGVKVLFPYKPYNIQLDYMKCVIKCLQQKSNGLLESPTGTGKTVCLLCAALGWLDTQRLIHLQQILEKSKTQTIDNPLSSVTKTVNGWQVDQCLPQILYSSRTHSQLSQACKELKKTSYNSYKSVVIGSRDQLCLDPDVSKLETISAKNQTCRHKIKHNLCAFYRGYEQKVEKNIGVNTQQVFDIEDLVTFGKRNTCCPYYASRHLQKKSSVVFTPYNYLLDPQIRKSNGLELKNSVVIFDEGHNIERICEESVSTELRSDTFAVCIKHINSILEKLKAINDGTYEDMDNKELSEIDVESVAKLQLIICDLEVAIDRLIKSKPTKTTHNTKIIFEIMERVGLEFNTSSQILDTMDKISSILTTSKAINTTQTQVVSAAFTAMAQFIERLIPIKITTLDDYMIHKMDFIQKFKIFSEKDFEEDGDKYSNFWTKKPSSDAWILHIWCLSPSIGAKAVLGLEIHSMIITSGTLAPIYSFETEMGINFPIKLENTHIIGDNQLAILNISKARDDTILTSKYDNRDNVHYYKALGHTLIETLRVVPKGVLVFFSSYTALNKSVQIWKEKKDNIWSKLNSVKQIFLEPRDKKTFADCMTKYRMKVDEQNSMGAAFFAVCRGKLSEGIDLPDDYCRCVIMTGLPFPSVADPRVILKKQYLNETKSKLTADGWYTLQMKRALNQAIGRVVRHKDDFGVIILMDSRFATLSDGLSKWVLKYIFRNKLNHLDESLKKLQTFFSSHSSNVTNNTPYVKTNTFIDNSKSRVLSQFKSPSNKSTKRPSPSPSPWSNPGFINGSTILNHFKSSPKSESNPFMKTGSVFDSMASEMSGSSPTTQITKICFQNSSDETVEYIDLDPSPKKLKLNVPLKSIGSPLLNESKAPEYNSQTPSPKTSGIIRNKSLNESNSAKKVQWNEEQNSIHEIETIFIDSTDETVNKMSANSSTSKVIDISGEDKEVKCSQRGNQQLVQFWRNYGTEFRAIFKNTNNFQQLCSVVKQYHKSKHLNELTTRFNTLFKDIEAQKRNLYIRELAVIVPKTQRQSFLEKCIVNELKDNQEFKVIERTNNCEFLSANALPMRRRSSKPKLVPL